MRPFLLSAALLSAAFVLGCQEQASSPVGPDTEIVGPAFAHNPNSPPGHGGGGGGGGGGGEESGGKAPLFDADGFTCVEGAPNAGGSVGNVSWAKVFVGAAANGADHVHYKVLLQDVDPTPEGIPYEILGNEDRACPEDFDFRIGRGGEQGPGNFITVKKNRQGSARGQLNFFVHETTIEPLTTNVWVTVEVTVNGVPKVLRSPAVQVVLPPHAEVP